MENKFENKMKQLSEVENDQIMPDIQIKASRQLNYPSKEELELKRNESGQYSMGAQTTYAPMPSDEEMYGQIFKQPKQSPKADTMLSGLSYDDEQISEKVNNFDTFDFAPSSKQVSPQKKIAQEKAEPKTSNANSILISNAKKQEVELELIFKAKIPVAAFFEAMDDAYVKKNQNSLLTEIINGLKMNELDKQLKEKLKEFYGLK